MLSCMMAGDYDCEMRRYDVTPWNPALDPILREVELSAASRICAHDRRTGRGTALWNTGVVDAIAQVLRKYSDEVEGLWVGKDRPDDPGKPVQLYPPESSAHWTVSHGHARTTPGRLHDLDVSHLRPLMQRQPPDDRASAI